MFYNSSNICEEPEEEEDANENENIFPVEGNMTMNFQNKMNSLTSSLANKQNMKNGQLILNEYKHYAIVKKEKVLRRYNELDKEIQKTECQMSNLYKDFFSIQSLNNLSENSSILISVNLMRELLEEKAFTVSQKEEELVEREAQLNERMNGLTPQQKEAFQRCYAAEDERTFRHFYEACGDQYENMKDIQFDELVEEIRTMKREKDVRKGRNIQFDALTNDKYNTGASVGLNHRNEGIKKSRNSSMNDFNNNPKGGSILKKNTSNINTKDTLGKSTMQTNTPINRHNKTRSTIDFNPSSSNFGQHQTNNDFLKEQTILMRSDLMIHTTRLNDDKGGGTNTNRNLNKTKRNFNNNSPFHEKVFTDNKTSVLFKSNLFSTEKKNFY